MRTLGIKADCFLILSWLLTVLAPIARGQHLVGVDAGAIVRRDLEGRGAMYVVKGQQNILDVDYDYQTGYVYWSNTVQKKIYRARMDHDSAAEEVLSAHYPGAVCVDWLRRRLYYSNTDQQAAAHILVANLDSPSTGSGSSVVMENIQEVGDIAIHPTDGILFWIDLGVIQNSGQASQHRDNMKIERLRLADSKRETLVTAELMDPKALAIDFTQRRLYWSDSAMERIESILFDGSDRRLIYMSALFAGPRAQLRNPHGLSIYRDQLYWSQPFERSLLRGSIDGTSAAQRLDNSTTFPTVLHVYSGESQPGVSSCASGWQLHKNHCYLFSVTSAYSAGAAENHCETAAGSGLLSVDNQEEMDWLIQYVNTNHPDIVSWWTSGQRGSSGWVWSVDDQQRAVSLPVSDVVAGSSGQQLALVSGDEDHLKAQDPSKQMPFICEQTHSYGVDPCSISNGLCGQLCLNNGFSSAYCACIPGYRLQDNLKMCEDVNECAASDGGPCGDVQCVNTAGGYRCECPTGFETDTATGGGCVDVNECLHDNGKCEQRCVNTKGSYNCECRWGYDLSEDGLTCRDTDECLQKPCQHNCTNTAGSFSCSCLEGFRLGSDGVSCSRITCNQQPQLDGFIVSCRSNVSYYGDYCKLSCITGELRGSGQVTCSLFGDWLISPTQCILEPPALPHATKVILSNNQFPESARTGVMIGSLSTDDPDNVYTFRLYDDTHVFEVTQPSTAVPYRLVLKSPVDYETRRIFNITISALHNSSTFSISTNITLKVLDVNESPSPPTLYPAKVREDAQPGTTVGVLNCTNPDVGQFVHYTLINHQNLFIVDRDQLKVHMRLDYEKVRNYTLVIFATDNGIPPLRSPNSYINLQVVNVNEPPTKIILSNNTVEEYVAVLNNIHNGTVIGELSALDPDEGDTFRFSVAHQGYTVDLNTHYACFAISEGNKLVVSEPLCFDYEKQRIFRPQIEVEDTGGNKYMQIVLIEVVNVNEPPTSILFSASAPLPEHSPLGTVAGLLFAVDEPGDGPHTFSIVSQTSLFKLNDNAVVVTGDIDFESSSMDYYNKIIITVRVTDPGDLSLVQNISITILDQPDSPTIKANVSAKYLCQPSTTALPQVMTTPPPVPLNEITICVDENTPVSTVIASFRAVAAGNQPATMNYTVFAADTRHFTTRGNDLVVAAGLDYERMFQQSPIVHVRGTAGAQNSGGVVQADMYITVRVRDVNEPPLGVRVTGSLVVPADHQVNLTIGRFLCHDLDSFGSDIFRYILVNGGQLPLEVDPRYGNITVTRRLTEPEYQLVVQCTDHAGLISPMATFTVEHQMDSSPPSLTIELVIVGGGSVSETTRPGTFIGTITVSAADSRTRRRRASELAYGLSLENADYLPFVVTPSGEDNKWYLELTSFLDYEDRAHYQLTLRATGDDGDVVFSTFTVTVADVQEPPSDILLDVTSIVEGPAGRQFGVAMLVDPEPGVAYTFGTESVELSLIPLSSTATTIFTKVALDYEEAPTFQFNLTVIEAGKPHIVLSKDFTIHVLNENEAPVAIAVSPEPAVVRENVTVGTTVATIRVTDPDTEPIGHRCELKDYGFNWFMVQAGFGLTIAIRTKTKIDFESPRFTADHSVPVMITCWDMGGLFTTTTIQIIVIDANEPPTDIVVRGGGRLQVTENADITTESVVARLQAIDPDEGDTHSFAVTNNVNFAMIGDNLVITASPDYEERTEHIVTVMATDSGKATFTKNLTVYVTNVNEAPTNITLPRNVAVLENSKAGTFIGQLVTDDPDDGQSFTYKIVSQDPPGAVRVQGDSLYVADGSVLDHETAAGGSVHVTMMTTDSGRPPRSHTRSLAVQIINVNEAPTDVSITTASGAVFIPEDAVPGSVVGNISVEDQDQGAGVITCELLDASRQRLALRHMDGAKGSGSSGGGRDELVVTARAKFDYETEKHVNVTIRCSDGEGQSITRTLSIEVRDSNDPPLGVLLVKYDDPLAIAGTTPDLAELLASGVPAGPAVVSVSEGRGPVLAHLYVLDEDNLGSPGKQTHACVLVGKDEYEKAQQAVTARLRRSVDAAELTITRSPEPGSPWLTLSTAVNHSLDYEQRREYVVYVRCSDSGNPSKSVYEELEILVEDTAEAPSDVTLQPAVVRENAPTDTLVGALTIRDDDLPSRGYMVTTADHGSGHQLFYVANSSLYVARNIDYESVGPRVSVTITVTELDTKLELTTDVVVTVTNVAEAPCCLTIDGGDSKYISMDTKPGSVVGTLAVVSEGSGLQYKLRPLAHGDNTAVRMFSIRSDTGDLILTSNLSEFNVTDVVIVAVEVTDSTGRPYTGIVYIGFIPDSRETCDPQVNTCPGHNSYCDPVAGYCTCRPGFSGPSCNLSVATCAGVTCPHGGVCYPQESVPAGYSCQCDEPFSPDCNSCMPGYSGQNCAVCQGKACGGQSASQTESTTNLGWIVGGILGALVLFIIILIIIVIILRLQRKKQPRMINRRVRYDSFDGRVSIGGSSIGSTRSGQYANPIYDTIQPRQELPEAAAGSDSSEAMGEIGVITSPHEVVIRTASSDNEDPSLRHPPLLRGDSQSSTVGLIKDGSSC